jgi:hypothetical protein
MVRDLIFAVTDCKREYYAYHPEAEASDKKWSLIGVIGAIIIAIVLLKVTGC